MYIARIKISGVFPVDDRCQKPKSWYFAGLIFIIGLTYHDDAYVSRISQVTGTPKRPYGWKLRSRMPNSLPPPPFHHYTHNSISGYTLSAPPSHRVTRPFSRRNPSPLLITPHTPTLLFLPYPPQSTIPQSHRYRSLYQLHHLASDRVAAYLPTLLHQW